MFGYLAILGAIPGFFLSALILVLPWRGLIAPNFGIEKIDYVVAMLITITLWLAVASLVAACWKKRM